MYIIYHKGPIEAVKLKSTKMLKIQLSKKPVNNFDDPYPCDDMIQAVHHRWLNILNEEV